MLFSIVLVPNPVLGLSTDSPFQLNSPNQVIRTHYAYGFARHPNTHTHTHTNTHTHTHTHSTHAHNRPLSFSLLCALTQRTMHNAHRRCVDTGALPQCGGWFYVTVDKKRPLGFSFAPNTRGHIPYTYTPHIAAATKRKRTAVRCAVAVSCRFHERRVRLFLFGGGVCCLMLRVGYICPHILQTYST